MDDELRNRLHQELSLSGTASQQGDGATVAEAKQDDDEEEDEEGDDETLADVVSEADNSDVVDILVDTTDMDAEQAMMFVEALDGAGQADSGNKEPDVDEGGATGDADGELSAEAEQEAMTAEDLFSDSVEQQTDDESDDVSKGDLFGERVEKQAEDDGSADDDVSKDDLFSGGR